MANTSESLASIVEKAIKKHGNVIKLGSDTLLAKHIPTTCFLLDLALLGGIPENVASCFTGLPRTAKTTMAMKTAGAFQRKYPDKIVLWVDAENSYDRIWAEKNGIDNDRLIHIDQITGENIIDIVDDLLDNQDIGFVVVDSVAMLNPEVMLTKSAENEHMAIPARMMSKFIRKLVRHLTESTLDGRPLTLLFINQWTVNPGKLFGDNKEMPAGNRQKYFYEVHVDFSGYKEELNKETGYLDHSEHRFSIKKTRLGSSILQGEFSLNRDLCHEYLEDAEIDDVKSVVTFAAMIDLVQGSGASSKKLTSSVSGEVLEFRTWDEMYKFLYANPEELATLKMQIIKARREANKIRPLPQDDFLIDRVWNEKETRETNEQ